MSNIMLELADNYQLGIGISSAVLIIIYILISIFAIRREWKLFGDIPKIMGMIPILNLYFFFKRKKVPEKPNEDEVIGDMF